jgi:hypothetical protein
MGESTTITLAEYLANPDHWHKISQQQWVTILDHEGEELMGMGLIRDEEAEEHRRQLEQRDERIAELEAQVRRLQRSDGPVHGPEPPPRLPCPKCGAGTWEIFGHDRVCHDWECGGVILAADWCWTDLLEEGDDE